MKKLLTLFCLLFISALAYDSINDQLNAMDTTLSDIGNRINSLEQHNSDIDTSLLKVDIFSLATKVWIVLACILFIVIDFIVTKIVLSSSIPEIIMYLKNTDFKKNELPKGLKLIIAKEDDIIRYEEIKQVFVSENQVKVDTSNSVSDKQLIPEQKNQYIGLIDRIKE
jgi:beta-lactamase regulating signal transducer with metallopeptidase domain